jgi:hypothetical protein
LSYPFQSKIQKTLPKIAPISPKIAPNIPEIIQIHAPARPTTKPNKPPARPIQMGNVIMSRITISAVEDDEVLVCITTKFLSASQESLRFA